MTKEHENHVRGQCYHTIGAVVKPPNFPNRCYEIYRNGQNSNNISGIQNVANLSSKGFKITTLPEHDDIWAEYWENTAKEWARKERNKLLWRDSD